MLDPNESTAKKVCTEPLFGSDWPRYIIKLFTLSLSLPDFSRAHPGPKFLSHWVFSSFAPSSFLLLREILLVLGDSGGGKSTLGRHLENELWAEYKPGGPVPFFVYLKTIETPDKDQLQQYLEDLRYFSDQ